ncbi:hypothetical protein EV424DRAFT_393452 [Suillus variegatus]|nr:hypothetical protein EV424DRAFT_393452 [Suillus variegatus]
MPRFLMMAWQACGERLESLLAQAVKMMIPRRPFRRRYSKAIAGAMCVVACSKAWRLPLPTRQEPSPHQRITNTATSILRPRCLVLVTTNEPRHPRINSSHPPEAVWGPVEWVAIVNVLDVEERYEREVYDALNKGTNSTRTLDLMSNVTKRLTHISVFVSKLRCLVESTWTYKRTSRP